MSINEGNNSIGQLQINKQYNLSTSKESEPNDTFQNNVSGKKMYIKFH